MKFSRWPAALSKTGLSANLLVNKQLKVNLLFVSQEIGTKPNFTECCRSPREFPHLFWQGPMNESSPSPIPEVPVDDAREADRAAAGDAAGADAHPRHAARPLPAAGARRQHDNLDAVHAWVEQQRTLFSKYKRGLRFLFTQPFDTFIWTWVYSVLRGTPVSCLVGLSQSQFSRAVLITDMGSTCLLCSWIRRDGPDGQRKPHRSNAISDAWVGSGRAEEEARLGSAGARNVTKGCSRRREV